MPDQVDDEPLDVSVVIPAYNRESIIGRAVLSALTQQPRRAAEVIVVDDGSSDGTADVAERLGARVIRQENKGEGGARNTGVEAATSTWLAFLDSDDEWLPQHLAVLQPHLDGKVLVGSAARCVPSGRLAGIAGQPRPLTPASIMWPQSPLVPSATMVRRDIALEVGGFRSLPTAADLDFFIRVLERGEGVVLPDVTAIYFEHGTQISVDNDGLKRGRTQVLRDYADRPWFPAGVLDDVDVSDRWDEFRRAQRAHEWGKAAADVGGLMRPRAVAALVAVWRFRYDARRR
jgi:glycosyltransferase involved in cell wall biosynthesis